MAEQRTTDPRTALLRFEALGYLSPTGVSGVNVERAVEERFPELRNFELELESPLGRWTSFRTDEDERSAKVLADADAVFLLLAGGYVYVEAEGVRTRCRITPKAWLEKTT